MSLDVSYVGQHSFNTCRPSTSTRSTSAPRSCRRTRIRRCRSDDARRHGALDRPAAADPRLQHHHPDAAERLEHLSLAPVVVPAPLQNGVSFGFNDTIGLSQKRQQRAAPPAHPDGSFVSAPIRRRPTSCSARREPPGAPHEGELRVGSARPPGARRPCCERSGWSSTTGSCRASGPAPRASRYTVGYSYQSGGTSVNLTGSPDYAARIRVVGDPGHGLQQRPLPAVQHGGVPGAAGRQRRPRVRERLPAVLLHQRARPVHRAQHPAWRRTKPAAARRHVQRAQLGDHHRAEHVDHPDEPERSGDAAEPAVSTRPAT